jgi:hypothetical protein
MNEQRRFNSDAELEGALVSLGQHLDYPPTPDLASTVRQRLIANRRPRSFQERVRALARSVWPAARSRLAVATLALLLALAGLLALDPDTRTVLADRLGLRGVTISQVPFVPTATPTASPSPSPTNVSTATVIRTPVPTSTPIPVGERLQLGQRVTFADARAQLPFSIQTPSVSELSAPDEVYLGDQPIGGQVALVYYPRPGLPASHETGVGLLLTEFRGDLHTGFNPVGKAVGPETRVEQLTVNGGGGYWLEGQPHMFFYRDSAGEVQNETIRLAGNTLLWEAGNLTLRLEGALTRDAALRIARSIR